MIRRLALALLALAFAGSAEAQAWRPGFPSGFRPGFQFLGSRKALPSAVPLPTVTGGYLFAYGLTKLITGYTGPAMRVQCGATATQVDVTFDVANYADVAGAKIACGNAELRILSWYDQATGKTATASATAPAVLPILTTQDAVEGSAYPPRPYVTHQGLIYPYPAAQVAGLSIPTSLSVDQRNVVFFDVAAPSTSIRLASISGLGGLAGTSRLPNTTQPGQSGFGVFTYTASGAGPTIRTAGYASAPRANLQVFGFASRDSGFSVFNEDISSSYAALESKTLTGGHLGGGNGTNASAYYTGGRFAAVATTGAITAAEEASIKSTLSAVAGTAKRPTRYILLGSSTPEGRGANNATALGYSTQSYFRVAVGGLSREVDAWNLGQSGQLSTAVLSNFANEVAPLITPDTIVSIDVGGNDIAVNNDTATNIGGRLKQIAQLSRSAGARAIIMKTLGQRTDITGSNGTAQKAQTLADLNAMIRDKATMGIDAVTDIDAIVALQNPGPSNPNYVQDTDGNYTHRSNAGQAIMGQADRAVIQGFVQ